MHLKEDFGIIGIHHHQISAIVGILPDERLREQTLFVDAKIKVDFSPCIASGKIKDSVDYSSLAALSTELAVHNQYELLETFANDFLKECMVRFPAVWAWVQIKKPSAIPTAAYAFVELERVRLA